MFDHHEYASRKYVDLIRRASSKWANWDPPVRIEVGSFGTINKKTGQLAVEGNIYEERFRHIFPFICSGFDISKHKPVEAEPENDMRIRSHEVKQLDLSVDGSLELAGITSASIKEEWQFPKSKSGALLVMHAPRQTYIPQDDALAQLAKVPDLENKCLVVSVVSCPAYFLHLSDKSGEKIKVTLGSSIPIPHAPGISVDGGCSLTWHVSNKTSLSRNAVHPEGRSEYNPLYTLKKFPKWNWFTRFQSPHMGAFFVSPEPSPVSATSSSSGSEVDSEISWDDALQPWSDLDDDGEESLSKGDLFADNDNHHSEQLHGLPTIVVTPLM